jgi:murein DD-endopeptidase MepM/ murein hydrolase activator NlpD
MKIIILSNPYKPCKEIDINANFFFKISVIPLIFLGVAIFFDWNINPFNRSSEISALELANYQMEQNLSELQKRLDFNSKRLELLAQKQDIPNSSHGIDPLVAMIATEQYLDNKKGGPLTLSNKQIYLESPQIQLDSILSKVHEFDYQLSEMEKSSIESAKVNQSVPTGSPLQNSYQISSPYGYRVDPFTKAMSLHEGVDLSAEANSKIYATAEGVVVHSGKGGEYGLMIQIKHDNGLMTRYGHARKLLVQVGDTVKKGQFIGLVGSTGRSTGNHLHYEVIFGGQSIDPEQLMKNN